MMSEETKSGSDRVATGVAGSAGADDGLASTRQMEVVYEVSKILSSAPNLASLLDSVVERLVNGVDAAEAAAIFLYSQSTQRLEPASVCGFNHDVALGMSLRPDESMTGRAYSTGEIQLFGSPEEVEAAVSSMSRENRRLFIEAVGSEEPPHSAICAPLISRGEKLGVLVLENLRGDRDLSKVDLGLVRAVADLIALAVQRERLQEEAEQARVLQEANRLKSELLSTLSHEMRTPLASIKGYATALLLESTDWGDATRGEFLRIIDEETDNLQNLIGDLLESSTIEAGLLRIERQPVLLRRVAERVVEQARLRARRHRFALSFPGDFPVVDADPHRIEQVLHNLVDNAVKYSPDGGLIVVRGEVRTGEVVLSVADQGVGIAPEHLNRLFERFFRIKSGLGPKVTGTGLGLPIARTIVETHGGRIWAESQVGAGTTMYFTLPRVSEEGYEDGAV